MRHKDGGHYARKHGPDEAVDPILRNTLMKRSSEGRLPCAVAFRIADELGVSPGAVGQAADLMELRLVKCQIGLFGYQPEKKIVKPAGSVKPDLKNAILAGLINECVPCKTVWDISNQLAVHKMKVSAACDAMGIKIKPCQLGAF